MIGREKNTAKTRPRNREKNESQRTESQTNSKTMIEKKRFIEDN